MKSNRISRLFAIPALAAALFATAASAQEIGRVKTASGEAFLVRGADRVPAALGAPVQRKDVIETGANGSLGVTFSDNSSISAGPNSRIALDDYQYEPSTLQGQFLANMSKGTMAVVSGDIARGSPDAMKVRTPTTVLGVRGTTFLVRVADDTKK